MALLKSADWAKFFAPNSSVINTSEPGPGSGMWNPLKVLRVLLKEVNVIFFKHLAVPNCEE